MNDVVYLAIFLIACAATFGLVKMCDWLSGRSQGERR